MNTGPEPTYRYSSTDMIRCIEHSAFLTLGPRKTNPDHIINSRTLRPIQSENTRQSIDKRPPSLLFPFHPFGSHYRIVLGPSSAFSSICLPSFESGSSSRKHRAGSETVRKVKILCKKRMVGREVVKPDKFLRWGWFCGLGKSFIT